MKIILNNLGVIIDGDYGNEVVNQSNHNINTLQFAIDDPDYQANYANYLATASFTFQGGEKEVTDILMGSTRFEFKGKAYNGYSMKLTRNLTGYAGDMSITFRLKNAGQQIVLASQPMQKMVTLTAGATVYAPNITQEQYNQLLEQVGLKIPFTEKGQPGGVATLAEDGKVEIDQIPDRALNVFRLLDSHIYADDSLQEIPRTNNPRGFRLIAVKIADTPLVITFQLRLIRDIMNSEHYTADDILPDSIEGKILMLMSDIGRQDKDAFKYNLYTANADVIGFQKSEVTPPYGNYYELITWQKYISKAGTKVGEEVGDAFDTCRGQKLEQMIDEDYLGGLAVSEYNEETGILTIAGNSDIIDRIDDSHLEEDGVIDIYAKITDYLNATEEVK